MVGEMKPNLKTPDLGIGSFVMQSSQFGLSQVGPGGIIVYPALEASFPLELWRAYLSWNYEELTSAPPPNFGLMS
jgi:hypothetical protein